MQMARPRLQENASKVNVEVPQQKALVISFASLGQRQSHATGDGEMTQAQIAADTHQPAGGLRITEDSYCILIILIYLPRRRRRGIERVKYFRDHGVM